MHSRGFFFFFFFFFGGGGHCLNEQEMLPKTGHFPDVCICECVYTLSTFFVGLFCTFCKLCVQENDENIIEVY